MRRRLNVFVFLVSHPIRRVVCAPNTRLSREFCPSSQLLHLQAVLVWDSHSSTVTNTLCVHLILTRFTLTHNQRFNQIKSILTKNCQDWRRAKILLLLKLSILSAIFYLLSINVFKYKTVYGFNILKATNACITLAMDTKVIFYHLQTGNIMVLTK